MMPQPPPLDYDELEPPPFAGDDDFFPIPDDDVFIPDDNFPPFDLPPLEQDGLQFQDPPEPLDPGWSWHDTRLIGLQREAGRYEVGAIDLFMDAHSGDLGGSYLPISGFDDPGDATAFYSALQWQARDLAPGELADFAEEQARTFNPDPEYWRSAKQAEYAAYEQQIGLDVFDPLLADDPVDLDRLLDEAFRLGGIVTEISETLPDLPAESSSAALAAIGVQAMDFDPQADPPPFYDPSTGTAYWIGVFQPDKDDREHCVTSILSLGRDAESGDLQAQLAPCVPGDWDKAYAAAEYLIEVAQQGGMERVFDIAEGMALATDQRDLWATERGVPLETDAARDIAAYARETWEVSL